MDWTKVVTEPTGLAGFALALVFGILGARRGMPRWWPAAAAGLASICVVGGLYLAKAKLDAITPTRAALPPKSEVDTKQEARADGGGTAFNVSGSGNAVNAPAGAKPNPVVPTATPPKSEVDAKQDASADGGGTAFNVNGSGNQITIPSGK